MSHGIYEHDRGYVKGSTWHKLEQYEQLNRAVYLDEALEVFDYEKQIEIVPNVANLGGGVLASTDSKSIVRRDTNTILNPAVGGRYTLLNMREISKLAYGQICEAFSDESADVEIESVGTLDNGAIQFISVIFDTFKVTGDDSETMNRLMITNDYQGGGVKQLISQVRVVCKNTRGMAIKQGKRNKSLLVTKHTREVNDTVKGNMLDMAAIQHQMTTEKRKLNILANAPILSYEKQKAVLQHALPVRTDSNGELVQKGSRNANKHEQILEVYTQGQDGIDSRYQKSPYAFFNAITNVIGREVGRSGTSADWDNVAGVRAKIKERAMDKMLTFA
jgi:hypothetical protein